MDPDSTDEMVDHLVDFFDQVANDYDSWAGGLHGRVAARLAEIVNPKRGHHALDVGSGRLNGDVKVGRLTVEDGATLNGNVAMTGEK